MQGASRLGQEEARGERRYTSRMAQFVGAQQQQTQAQQPGASGGTATGTTRHQKSAAGAAVSPADPAARQLLGQASAVAPSPTSAAAATASPTSGI